MRSTTLAFAVALSGGGCSLVPVEPPGTVCPVPLVYSEDFQNRLAGEVEQLDEGSAVVRVLLDYSELRIRLKECRRR